MSLVPVSNNGKRIILHSGGSRVFHDTEANELHLISQLTDHPSHAVRCFACGQLIEASSSGQTADNVDHGYQDQQVVGNADVKFIDSNYFRLLAAIYRKSAGKYPIIVGPPPPVDSITAAEDQDSSSTSETINNYTQHKAHNANLPANVLNQGYYEKFFKEIGVLGRGYRGAVFSCQHILDNVVLGEYAVKKIPIGDNKEWMLRMLREVYTLEQMRHFNVIEYRHCWIEDAQLNTFGPSVPCLFLLMELANGGNLEEYIVAKTRMKRRSADSSPTSRRTLSFTQYRHGKSQDNHDIEDDERPHKKPAALNIREIWSFFLDICNGLEHLHSHGIIHRDLKPSNLLLTFPTAPNLKAPPPPSSSSKDELLPRVLISDFGESENLRRTGANQSGSSSSSRTGHTGTVEFTAPELLKTDSHGRYHVDHTPSSDIWSLGLVLYNMCFSSLPYRSADSTFDSDDGGEFDVDKLKEEILQFKSTSTPLLSLHRLQSQRPDLPPQLFKLIQLMLSMNPRDRPSAKDILKLLSTISDNINLTSPGDDPSTTSPLTSTSSKAGNGKQRKSEFVASRMRRDSQRALVSPRSDTDPVISSPLNEEEPSIVHIKPAPTPDNTDTNTNNIAMKKWIFGIVLAKVSMLMHIASGLSTSLRIGMTILALIDILIPPNTRLSTVLFILHLFITAVLSYENS